MSQEEKLDDETGRRLDLVLQKYYGRGVERCGCNAQDLAAVNALRNRIRELCEEARKKGQDQIIDHYRLHDDAANGFQNFYNAGAREGARILDEMHKRRTYPR